MDMLRTTSRPSKGRQLEHITLLKCKTHLLSQKFRPELSEWHADGTMTFSRLLD
jgi:hypothetical protein